MKLLTWLREYNVLTCMYILVAMFCGDGTAAVTAARHHYISIATD